MKQLFSRITAEKCQALKGVWHFFFLTALVLQAASFSGCTTVKEGLGFKKLDVPPEFNQTVLLEVQGDYEKFQATRSGYDVGDLQNFHTQHTFPIVIEDAFKEMFSKVEIIPQEAKIDTSAPDVPAIFEVKILDLANDVYDGGEDYRSQAVLAVAMKTPEGEIMWQKAFRGEGYVHVDPQFGTGLGPEQAVLDAMRDALDQMQKAIVAAPEVRTHMKYYQSIDAARKEKEVQL